jgi:tetratricopeptide (TPR) repeat protein
MLTTQGTAKIIDFGLARVRRNALASTKIAGTGTLLYMAPEKLEGQGGGGSKADIYAYAILVCELWTGKEPFTDLDQYQVKMKVLAGDRPKIPFGSVPEYICMTIRACWRHDPAERPDVSNFSLVLAMMAVSGADAAALVPKLSHLLEEGAPRYEPPPSQAQTADGKSLPQPHVASHATRTWPEGQDRYFRAKIRGSDGTHGFWYAHFRGQAVARQFLVQPGKDPKLLVAGQPGDDAMGKLDLDKTGLTKKRGAEILSREFQVVWSKHGGVPLAVRQDSATDSSDYAYLGPVSERADAGAASAERPHCKYVGPRGACVWTPSGSGMYCSRHQCPRLDCTQSKGSRDTACDNCVPSKDRASRASIRRGTGATVGASKVQQPAKTKRPMNDDSAQTNLLAMATRLDDRRARRAEIATRADDICARVAEMSIRGEDPDLQLAQGDAMMQQGCDEEALDLYKRALKTFKKTLGQRHEKTADTYSRMGEVCWNQDRLDEGLEYFGKALATYRSVLGERHPSTADTFTKVASIYLEQHQLREALECFHMALMIYRWARGEQHESTADAYANVAATFLELNRLEEAYEHSSKALAIYRKVLGEHDPDTARASMQLADVHHALGHWSHALDLYEKAHEVFLALYGPDHEDTVEAASMMGTAEEDPDDESEEEEFPPYDAPDAYVTSHIPFYRFK